MTLGGTPSPHHPKAPEVISAGILYRSGIFAVHVLRRVAWAERGWRDGSG